MLLELTERLGFVGAGQMARAIGISLMKKGIVKPSQILVSSPEKEHLEFWKEKGCDGTFDNEEVLKSSRMVIWAVKPQIFSQALPKSPISIKNQDELIKSKQFHISIMAGIKLDKFSQKINSCFSANNNQKLVMARAMPNIGLLVGNGCSVFTLDKGALEDDKKKVEEIFTSGGLCFEVPEHQINAFCGLFASGIGFMFPILEALSDGGVKVGIPRDLANVIAGQTMKGAAELYLSSSKVHAGTLKDSVCSPGGTTICGVATLEKFGVRNAFIQAVESSTKRGQELE